jgi:hypothetical protein
LEVHPRPIYAKLEKVGIFQEWFDVYELTEGTYAIYERNQFEEAISYLVLGSARGVLIDAGTRIGDIKAVAEKLTDLPVSSVSPSIRFLPERVNARKVTVSGATSSTASGSSFGRIG